MAIQHDLRVMRGEAAVLLFDVDEDITGWTLAFHVGRSAPDADALTYPVTITDAALGECEVSLTAAHTAAWTASQYYWELARTSPGAEAVLGYGTLHVQPRVPAV